MRTSADPSDAARRPEVTRVSPRTHDGRPRPSREGGARAPPHRARRARGRGVRRGQRPAARAALLHLAPPVQRRRGAQVHRVPRPRAPGRVPRAPRTAPRLRGRALRPLARRACGARWPRRGRARSTTRRSCRCPDRAPSGGRSAATTTRGCSTWTTSTSSPPAGASSPARSGRSRPPARLAELAESEEGLRRLGLLLGGDVTIVQERVAIASTHLPESRPTSRRSSSPPPPRMVEADGREGLGLVHRHPARRVHRRGRRRGGARGDPRRGRRARAARAATGSSSGRSP